jgi:hypothetical protein
LQASMGAIINPHRGAPHKAANLRPNPLKKQAFKALALASPRGL